MNQLYNPTTEVYVSLWNKYRPAILKLMMDCETGPQQYQFFPHEFKALNAREKGGYTFTMQVSGGKALNNIRDSKVAQQLLLVLAQSKKGAELMTSARYEFILNKEYVLKVSKLVAESAN